MYSSIRFSCFDSALTITHSGVTHNRCPHGQRLQGFSIVFNLQGAPVCGPEQGQRLQGVSIVFDLQGAPLCGPEQGRRRLGVGLQQESEDSLHEQPVKKLYIPN